MSSSPDSPPTGSAPSRTIFIPVYCFGLCEAVTAMPPSSPSSPTAKYTISVPTIPRSSTSARRLRPLDDGAAMDGDESAHVSSDGDPLRLELLDVGAADRVGALLVQLAP